MLVDKDVLKEFWGSVRLVVEGLMGGCVTCDWFMSLGPICKFIHQPIVRKEKIASLRTNHTIFLQYLTALPICSTASGSGLLVILIWPSQVYR